jgi:hypothetical protein
MLTLQISQTNQQSVQSSIPHPGIQMCLWLTFPPEIEKKGDRKKGAGCPAPSLFLYYLNFLFGCGPFPSIQSFSSLT